MGHALQRTPAVSLALTKTRLSLWVSGLWLGLGLSVRAWKTLSVSDTKLGTFLHLHSIAAAERGQPQEVLRRELGILFL